MSFVSIIFSHDLFYSCGGNNPKEDDIGETESWPLFPLVSLRLDDAGDRWEAIYFQMGALVCQQGMLCNHV